MMGTDERILFDSTEYSTEKCEAAAAGLCLRFAIGERRNTHKPLCDGTCGRSHNVPSSFRLGACRAEQSYALAKADTSGGKGAAGGGKRGGEGGKGGGKRSKGGK